MAAPGTAGAAAPTVEPPSLPPGAGTGALPASFAALAKEEDEGARRSLLTVVGEALYTLGFAGEYHLTRFWRFARHTLTVLAQLALWVLGGLWRWLVGFAVGVARDVAAPFRQFTRKLRQARRLRERIRLREAAGGTAHSRGMTGAGLKNSLRLAVAVMRSLLPLAAAAVLVATVYVVTNVEYALAVEVEGTVLGYVTDQNVVEGAKGLLRERIVLAEDQRLSDWQLTPSYSLAHTTTYTTTHQLVNAILLNTADDTGATPVPANGLYIDGTLYAVTTEGQRLAQYLEEWLDNYRDPEEPEAEVSYVKKVECDLNPDDLFFASSVVPYDELVRQLNTSVNDEVRYTTREGDTLDTIAHDHGITLDLLLQRNPDLAEQPGDHEPQPGTRLLIKREQPFLQVQKRIRRSNTETIPYNTVETPNDARPVGYTYRTQNGAEGLQEVWDDYYYIDGELQTVERVDELTVVLQEPQDEIVEVGTVEISANAPAVGGIGGFYIFPVPGSPYSSRGFSGGYHPAMDINAPGGTPIYACEGGTVVTAGWHWSYGNHIVIEHPGGISTLYAHCSALFVVAGQQVGQGQHIAAVGTTGVSTGNHLHLEVRVNGMLTDPVPFVGYPY